MKKLVLGDFQVYPVQDVMTEIDMSLFRGPLSAAELAGLLPGGRAESSGNVFIIKNGGQVVMIDAGWGESFGMQGKTRHRMRELGLRPEDVDLILLTHLHFDHAMGLLQGEEPVFPRARVLASSRERDFLLRPQALDDEKTKVGAELTRRLRAAYTERFGSFEYGESPVSGITALDARGHTPGHAAFRIRPPGDQHGRGLLIAGDFIHAAALQFPYPDEYPVYDYDPAAAVKMRRSLCDLAVAERLYLAGMHLPAPGIGEVRPHGEGYFFKLLDL